MSDPLRVGDAVEVIASGARGKVYSLNAALVTVRVRLATGSQAGQIRRFRVSSLRRL